jgi:nitrate reductase NapE component
MFSLIAFIAIPVVAVAFLSGRFTGNYAAAKGRSKRAWFVWGALLFPLFPIPWIVLELLPNNKAA